QGDRELREGRRQKERSAAPGGEVDAGALEASRSISGRARRGEGRQRIRASADSRRSIRGGPDKGRSDSARRSGLAIAPAGPVRIRVDAEELRILLRQDASCSERREGRQDPSRRPVEPGTRLARAAR